MNNGFFGFPSANSEGTSKVTQFDSSGAYMILPGTKRLYIFAVGGGGGGGGGARAPAGVAVAGGGGGGGGGGMVCAQYNVEDLGGIGVSLIINIGAGGIGGAAASANTSPGIISSGSGSTQIYVSGKPGILINALAGNPGNPGTNGSGGAAAGSSGFVRYNFPRLVGSIGASGGGGSPNPSSITVTTIWSHGGAGGGGVSTASVAIPGGSIQTAASTTLSIISSDFTRSGTIYSPGAVNTVTPPPNSSVQISGVFSPGVGGPGGGGGASVSANAGGNGYRGSGGGGGGGSLNGIAAGAGGNGGNGYVAIYAVI